MFNKIKNYFSKKSQQPVLPKVISPPTAADETKVKKKRASTRKPKPKPDTNSKEENLSKIAATQAGEPYINILSVELDPSNINNGSFELDWNDKFVLNLIRAGYKIREDDTDQVIVDRWFQAVCRNIALEIYEQEQADPMKRDDIRIIRSRDIGNGRSEVS